MKRINTIIIGGGQAGLAMSRCLGERGVDHVILERGRVAERWRSERWDSLRLLTPRWQSRLPGWSYQGPDRDGFMNRSEVIDYLSGYARSFDAPVLTGVTVTDVEQTMDGFIVRTDSGDWRSVNVVLATGFCDSPHVPAMAGGLSKRITQVVTTRYRNADQLPDGGVLVVGASATGVQLAAEIARSGRPVTLSVGRHIRLPRRYRGRDIMAWYDAMGITTQTARDVWDIEASRRQPSMQLTGSDDHRSIDLNTLREMGVRIVGRAIGSDRSGFYLADDLAATIGRAESKMHAQLDRIDGFIARSNIDDLYPVEERPKPVTAPVAPEMLKLNDEGIGAVLWATGFRRDYSWLKVPVLDAAGELINNGGITPVEGLYALGLRFQRRRNSSFIDGVGADAVELAAHLVKRLSGRYRAVA